VELGIAGSFHFLGNRAPVEARRIVGGADLLVAPSIRDGRWAEGFGLVGIEALLVGTPVVAYDSGALKEVLAPCAPVVPEGDRVALAKAIINVLEDPDKRQQIVTCGQKRAREQFSVERAVREYTERYAVAAREAA
jgi:glycosyltransferase involved in cell wall biosynthesis